MIPNLIVVRVYGVGARDDVLSRPLESLMCKKSFTDILEHTNRYDQHGNFVGIQLTTQYNVSTVLTSCIGATENEQCGDESSTWKFGQRHCNVEAISSEIQCS